MIQGKTVLGTFTRIMDSRFVRNKCVHVYFNWNHAGSDYSYYDVNKNGFFDLVLCITMSNLLTDLLLDRFATVLNVHGTTLIHVLNDSIL